MADETTTNVEVSATRGEARRRLILDTVVTVLASAGLSGLTHRAVDAAAALPEGSTSYYFRRRADLLKAAGAHVAERLAADDAEQRIEFAELMASGSRGEAMMSLARGLIACADEKRDLFLARCDLTLAASRDPELAGLGRSITSASLRPIEFFLRAFTDGGDRLPIVTTAGLLDGLALNHVTADAPMPSAEEIVEIVTRLLAVPVTAQPAGDA